MLLSCLIQGWYAGGIVLNWINQWDPEEATMANLLIEYGPVTTTYTVTNDFYSYSSGVFVGADCCDQTTDPDCK